MTPAEATPPEAKARPSEARPSETLLRNAAQAYAEQGDATRG